MKDVIITMSHHTNAINIVVENDNYKKVIKVLPTDIRVHNIDKEPKAELLARRKEVEDEFYRIAESIRGQGDIDCIIDLIPVKIKADFVKDWKENGDEGDEV